MADVAAFEPVDVLGLQSAGRGGRDAYAIENAAADPPDVTPPTIENVSPATGSMLDPSDPIVFDVLDDSSTFATVAVFARFPLAGLYEVVHDGTGFGPQYGGGLSTRAAVAGGHRFTLRRHQGWPRESISIRVLGVDAAGNVAVTP